MYVIFSELNSQGTQPSLEREREFIVVCLRLPLNVECHEENDMNDEIMHKKVMNAQSFCFAYKPIDLVVAITLYYQKLPRIIAQTFPELSLPVVLSHLNLEHFETNNVG